MMDSQEDTLLVLLNRATPIYLLVLRAQEVGNESFWNKKKCCFLESDRKFQNHFRP